MRPEARTAAINQLKDLLVTAPASLREALDGRSTPALVAACARLRPDETAPADPVDATKAALRAVACRIHQLEERSAWPISGWPSWSAAPHPGC